MKKFKYYKEGFVYCNSKEEARGIILGDEDQDSSLDIYEEFEGMERWDYDIPNDKQKYVKITSITVPTEYDKEQLLMAFEYIHNLRDIDTDYHAVNTFCHFYAYPEKIIVEGE